MRPGFCQSHSFCVSPSPYYCFAKVSGFTPAANDDCALDIANTANDSKIAAAAAVDMAIDNTIVDAISAATSSTSADAQFETIAAFKVTYPKTNLI